jgi:hypothetical protein
MADPENDHTVPPMFYLLRERIYQAHELVAGVILDIGLPDLTPVPTDHEQKYALAVSVGVLTN